MVVVVKYERLVKLVVVGECASGERVQRASLWNSVEKEGKDKRLVADHNRLERI